MKRTNPFALLIAWLGLAASSTHEVHAADGNANSPAVQQTGSITGQVSNAATRSFLQGAVVTLSGTNQTSITDREGRYHLNSVPTATGEVTIEVTFAGLDAQRIAVSVGSGQRVVRDVGLTSEIYKMDKFAVAGEREGTAKAETLQRQAPNVKTVVSADTFGNEASGNIGEVLQRMSGITGNYNGPDIYQVTIRGGGPNLNSVTMDGQQVSSDGNNSTGRQFSFAQASLGNVETIEVTKAPTPDMDGASIGGSVNFVSKSAFDRAAGRVVNYSIGFTAQPGYSGYAAKWKQPVKGYGPSMNFSYSDVLGKNKNIAIMLTHTFHSQPVGGTIINHAFERKNDPGPVFDYNVNRLDVAGATRTRIATGMKLDYRWSNKTTVSLNTFYNYFHENNDTRQHILGTVGVPTVATPQVLATVDSNGNRTGGGYIHPNYSNGITRVYSHPTLSGSNLWVGTNNVSGRTYLFSPMVRHRFDGLDIDYSVSYSNSATYQDNAAADSKAGGRTKGRLEMELKNIGWTVDRSQYPIYPVIKQTEGPDMYDLNNYSKAFLSQINFRSFDTLIGGKFDLRKELGFAVPTYLKTGFNVKQQSRKRWDGTRKYNYTGPDGILGTSDDNRDLAQFLDRTGIITTDAKEYYQDRGGIPPWPYSDGAARHLSERPELWKEDVAFGAQTKLQSLKTIKETISTAYIMGNIRLGKVSVLTGARMEDTRGSGEGPLNYISPAEKARRAAWVGPVTDPEARRRAEAQFGGRDTNEGQYRVVLPGIHLKYEPFAGLLTRLSWSTGVGRPDFGTIIPNTVADDDIRRVTVSNPELKPQYANNYDLTAEYYFKPQGMFSVGVFRKKIADYIFTDSSQIVSAGSENGFEGQYAGYSLTTQVNGGSATIEGIEFSYQQQLSFLPGWSKGFGVYTNFTSLKTEGNYGGTTVLTNNSLAGFVNESGNLGLSYRGYGLDLRLQAIYRGKYLTSNSTTPALMQYQKAKTMWAWKSKYDISKNISIFFDIENIFSVPLDTRYAAYEDRVISSRTYHAKIVAGLTGRF